MLKGSELSSVLGNTLHGDGTTKYHRHFQTYQVTTSVGKSLSVGLIETAGQDAQTILSCWKERVSEIAKAVSGVHASETEVIDATNKLISSIRNTMSDQCATNGLFNSLLLDLRKDLLPSVVNNWDSFSNTEQTHLIEMGNFFVKFIH